MMRHDESLLWEYAARELETEDARLVQHHLTECPECQEKLSDVRTAQGALKAARGRTLGTSYAKVDQAIAKVVEKKMAQSAFGRPWLVALSSGLVAAGLALVAYGAWSRLPVDAPPSPIAEIPAPRPIPRVERALGLTRVGAQSSVVNPGAAVASGDVLRTGPQGDALLKLPEGSRVRIAPDTQVALTRTGADEVALTLERGRIAVAASHAQRKGFVVHSGGLLVSVLGTRFSVESSRDGIEIAVSEGRVSVEPPSGLPLFVNAGHRAHFDSRWRQSRGTITAGQKKELAALGTEMVVAAAPPPPPSAPVVVAAVPSAGGSRRVAAPAQDELPPIPPLPIAAEAIAAPRAAEAQPPLPNPMTADEMKRPTDRPDMTGMQMPLISLPVEAVKPASRSAMEGLNEWPVAAAPKAGAAKLGHNDELALDAEAIRLTQIERTVSEGTCERYLPGLDEVASDPSRSDRAEYARILRARCYDALLKPKAAYQEYRRYLQAYPRGKFADEARHVMGED